MSTEETGGAAFPQRSYEEWGGTEVPGSPEMALRDYFAAKAMQGIVMADLTGVSDFQDRETVGAYIARKSYTIADYMIMERAK